MFEKSKALWELMRGQRRRYVASMGVMVVGVLAAHTVPIIGATVIDLLEGDPLPEGSWRAQVVGWLGGPEVSLRHLWLSFVAVVFFTAVSGFCGYLRGRWAAQASESTARGVRDKLYDHLQRVPCAYHDRTPTGDLVQRCTSDVETIRMFLARQITEVARAITMVATALPFMIALSPAMTGLAMVMVPLIVTFAAVFFRKVRTTFKVHDEAEGKMTSVLQENLSGIRVVRAFARQDFEKGKFATANAGFRDTGINLIWLLSWYWSSSDFLVMAQRGLVLAVGGWWIVRGQMTAGVLFAFMVYLQRLLWPLRQMGRVLTDFGKALVSLGRVQEILNQPVEAAAPATPRPPAPTAAPRTLSGAIRFRDVRFDFTDQAVLRGVSFDVPAGQTVALLGPSGAGKSTLIHLLLRLYDYTEGSITLDGRELAEMDRHLVRSQIGTVLQEPFLYSKTLRDNIAIAHVHADDAAVTQAAAVACLDESIQTFEAGYNTLVGERGVMLSGGQRQRVALARAVLKDPPILILDDALSAVDTQTESLILNALRRRHGRRTTLIIAHRISTLMQADRIVVLEHGRVTQIGTHDELLRREGLYRRLWAIQTSLEEELADEMETNNDSRPGAADEAD